MQVHSLGKMLWESSFIHKDSCFIVDGEPCDISLNITWYLKSADCYNEIYNFKVRKIKLQAFLGLQRSSSPNLIEEGVFCICGEELKIESMSPNLQTSCTRNFQAFWSQSSVTFLNVIQTPKNFCTCGLYLRNHQ